MVAIHGVSKLKLKILINFISPEFKLLYKKFKTSRRVMMLIWIYKTFFYDEQNRALYFKKKLNSLLGTFMKCILCKFKHFFVQICACAFT